MRMHTISIVLDIIDIDSQTTRYCIEMEITGIAHH